MSGPDDSVESAPPSGPARVTLERGVGAGAPAPSARPSDTGLDHGFRFGLQRILDGIGLLVDARASAG